METEYFQYDAGTAGLRKSGFVHRPLSIKLEGSERVGKRIVSLLFCKNRETPILFLETIGKTRKDAWEEHQAELEMLETFEDETQPSIRSIDAGDAFKWSIYHLLENEPLIREHLFPVTIFKADGRNWQRLKEIQGDYKPIGLKDYEGILEEEKLAPVEVVTHSSSPVASRLLVEMAGVIRSKNAGVNRITYEVYFHSKDEYRQALESGRFEKRAIAELLQIPMERMIGSFRAEACHAIKITASRAVVSGTPGDRDVFGAQQHAKLISMKIPIYA